MRYQQKKKRICLLFALVDVIVTRLDSGFAKRFISFGQGPHAVCLPPFVLLRNASTRGISRKTIACHVVAVLSIFPKLETLPCHLSTSQIVFRP
jgi:hypothetical protein